MICVGICQKRGKNMDFKIEQFYEFKDDKTRDENI